MSKVKDIQWREYQKMLIPNVSPNINISINKNEAIKLLSKSSSLMIRWTSKFDSKNNSLFWYIICDEYKGINSLKKSTQSEIRRGIKNSQVKIVNYEWIKKNGFNIYSNAENQYGKSGLKMKSNQYKSKIKKILNEKKWDIWGIESIANEAPIGYALIKLHSDSVELSVLKIHPKYLIHRPSYNLIFNILDYYLLKGNFKFINAGMRSLYHETNFQDFLIKKFNFRKAFCELNILYKKKIFFIIYVLKFLSKIGLFKILKINPKINALIIQDSIANEKKSKIKF